MVRNQEGFCARPRLPLSFAGVFEAGAPGQVTTDGTTAPPASGVSRPPLHGAAAALISAGRRSRPQRRPRSRRPRSRRPGSLRRAGSDDSARARQAAGRHGGRGAVPKGHRAGGRRAGRGRERGCGAAVTRSVASAERRLGRVGRHGADQGVRQGGGLLQGTRGGPDGAGPGWGRWASFHCFALFLPKNALKNGECSEPLDKPEQRLGMKRKNNKKNRNRRKSNTAPLKQVTSTVDASDARAACCTSLWCSKAAF